MGGAWLDRDGDDAVLGVVSLWRPAAVEQCCARSLNRHAPTPAGYGPGLRGVTEGGEGLARQASHPQG